MEEYRRQIVNYLMEDSELVNMLGANKPWWDKTASADKKHSIIPANKGPLPITPYLTVRISSETLVGYNLVDAFMQIRCYNTVDKTFVNIDEVLSRVKALLHRHRFDFSAAKLANIDVTYDSSLDELYDEGWEQNFRDVQYKIQAI